MKHQRLLLTTVKTIASYVKILKELNGDLRMNQPTLFEEHAEKGQIEQILLFALGDFQSRGMELVERELPLDRLLGAFKRATEHFNAAELSDEQIAQGLQKLGANVKKVPTFVAKHPFRVTVSVELAEKSRKFYHASLNND